MSAQTEHRPEQDQGLSAWALPDWLPVAAWLTVAVLCAIQIALSPHAMLAGSWCGEGNLFAAASILGHCPACYGLAVALAMAAASAIMRTPQVSPDPAS